MNLLPAGSEPGLIEVLEMIRLFSATIFWVELKSVLSAILMSVLEIIFNLPL